MHSQYGDMTGTVIIFPMVRREPKGSGKSSIQHRTAEIVIFPGVRIERLGTKKPSGNSRRRKKASLK